jgi:hypothetical protein
LKLGTPLLQAVVGCPLSGRSGSRIPCGPQPVAVAEPTASLLVGTSKLLAITLVIRRGNVRDHPIANRAGDARNLGLERTDCSSDLGDRGAYLGLCLLGRRTQAGKLGLHSFCGCLDRV